MVGMNRRKSRETVPFLKVRYFLDIIQIVKSVVIGTVRQSNSYVAEMHAKAKEKQKEKKITRK